MTPQERFKLRGEFDAKASLWRQNFLRQNEATVRTDTASRWQLWLQGAALPHIATWTSVEDTRRNHKTGNLWWCGGNPPHQATFVFEAGLHLHEQHVRGDSEPSASG